MHLCRELVTISVHVLMLILHINVICNVLCLLRVLHFSGEVKKVQVGKDPEKAQSEKDSHSKNRAGNKNKLTIRYLYQENIS